jgi:hypothetical protein
VHRYSHSHKDGDVVLREADLVPARESSAIADLLAYIADIDARSLYAPAGYSSIHAYCVERLRIEVEVAYKRIRAARVARDFPVLFPAIAAGRLHLTAVILLAPHLTEDNAEDLVAAATHKSRSEVAALIAERFGRKDPSMAVLPLAPGPVGAAEVTDRLDPNPVDAPGETGSGAQLDLDPVDAQVPDSRATSCAADRYALQQLSRPLREKIEYAQSLMSHRVRPGDAVTVLNRALDSLIAKLEQQKFGATTRPRRARTGKNPRHVPNAVKRAVWLRDQGRCTFVSEDGHRCGSRQRLEFDHVEAVGRGGGEVSVSGIRLRCRTHNQLEAERTYGAAFMQHKREQAKRAAAETRARREAAARAAAAERVESERAARARADEVVPWLRSLQVRADDAKRAAEHAASHAAASLEERVRLALAFLGRSRARTVRPAGGGREVGESQVAADRRVGLGPPR